jgi:hypothetical protein
MVDPIYAVNFQEVSSGFNEGFQCIEPYLLVFSIGVVPARCKHTHAISFDIAYRKSRRPNLRVSEEFTVKTAEGRLAKGLTPSEEGRFNGSMIEYVRALFSALRTAH